MPESPSPTASAPPPHGGRPVVTAGAPRGATDVLVLALHGRGATAQGVVNLLDPAYRHGVTFLAPDAHRSRWYPYAATAGRDRNEPDVSSAIAVVDALVAHATSTLSVDRDRVVLTGFSQGATVAAEYALANPTRYGAVALLSGTAIDPGERHATAPVDETEDAASPGDDFAGTPVLLAAGGDDPHVTAERVDATAGAFRDRGAEVDVRVADGVGHEVTDDALACVGALVDAAGDRA
ncbi:dienelactone hydrolase family protein [Halorubellus sp. PRR65]|uniref:alpha/beta hydrolase n=1 Tax=Halorubellus sp. PRR65 TaxID=3098148 RepID=UPI002B25C446|nr:dienelactone hydrolase family protein [Halorubellus sp. PRR65]